MDKSSYETVLANLPERGFKVLDAEYQKAAFGSWIVDIGSTPRLRIVWDGKDGWLYIQRMTNQKFWNMPVWEDLWIAREVQEQTTEMCITKLLQYAGEEPCC